MEYHAFSYTYGAPFINMDKGDILKTQLIKVKSSSISVNYLSERKTLWYPEIITLTDRTGISGDELVRRLTPGGKQIFSFTYKPTSGRYTLRRFYLGTDDANNFITILNRIRSNQDFYAAAYIDQVGKDFVLQLASSGQYVLFPQKVNPSGTVNVSKAPTFTVVEFAWDLMAKELSPVLIRSDKELPNEMRVAEDVWHMIQSPILNYKLYSVELFNC